MQTTITSKGQVTIPRDLRRHFGLQAGMSVQFEIAGDHIAIRPAAAAGKSLPSGFGLVKDRRSSRTAVPVDFDVAGLADAP